MTLRTLGQSDLKITPIGIGAWAIGGGQWEFAWGAQDDAESIAAIQAGLDRGINWIDTAAVYGLGHSETVVGRAIKGLRQTPIYLHQVQPGLGRIRKNLAQPAGRLHSPGSRGQSEAAGSRYHRSLSNPLAGLGRESRECFARLDRRGCRRDGETQGAKGRSATSACRISTRPRCSAR